MRLASIRVPGGPRPGIGVAVPDGWSVVRVDLLDPAAPETVLGLLSLPGEEQRRYARLAAEAAGRSGHPAVTPLEQTPLGPPVQPSPKVICLALNYRAHAAEGGFVAPKRPVIFFKGPNSLTGHGADIAVPPITRRIDHEGELAVVIGRRCKGLTDGNWQEAVAGYAVMNDLTARDLQLADIEARHPWDFSKSIDGYGPIGPWLVTPDEVPDPQALDLEVRVDGELRQKSTTGRMIFGVRELLTYISSVVTLEPGDIIATGTPDGIGPVPDGSTVEVRVGHLGVLRNRVVFDRESPRGPAVSSPDEQDRSADPVQEGGEPA
ncbi:fumarylacetoacetate hydrolase family protein [Streptomyces sp. NPDC005202]|uniref:fumarylacetoacetate hydrolase family protein n=1 Tax=Streptomyces sp. NPDC005202 TaxID=3157021 RepID=UPI0033BA463D